MNNFNNHLEIDKINSQLEKADIKKSTLMRNIYREYEFYLKLVRDILYVSVEKGLDELFNNLEIKHNFLNSNQFFCLYEKKISKLIYKNLPLLTVEQLKINENKKNLSKEINLNNLGIPSKANYEQNEKFQYEDIVQLEEPILFKISEDISDNYEYYNVDNNEKFVSLNLDNKYTSNNNIFENIGFEKQFISSILELVKEVRVEKTRHSEKNNINQINISSKHKSLKIFDLIDESLEKLLLNLSYKINEELFRANLIRKMISQDSYEFLVGNKLMIKHPHPFVINFELNINQSTLKGENLPSIFFFNVSIVELEFKNLNLSIQRNKINELKNQFQRLIKKEKYWRQKEITLNKIR